MHVFITGAQSNLAAVENRVTMLKPDDDIVTGISVVDSPGHTPGHISLLLAGDTGLLIRCRRDHRASGSTFLTRSGGSPIDLRSAT